LEGELKEKADSLNIAKAFENDMVIIRKLARNFSREFDKLPFEKRRMMVLHFIERIDIIDHSIARVILRIPKLTPGKTLKPPMMKKTRKEIELELGKTGHAKHEKASPDANQVRHARLPVWL